MIKMIYNCQLLLLFLLNISTFLAAQPEFPQIFDLIKGDTKKLHIVAESTNANDGYQTIDEYVDLNLGKECRIVTDKNGHSMTYVDALKQAIYRYRPYTCIALRAGVIDLSEELGLWTAIVTLNDDDGIKKEMHVYGIVAVWINAIQLPKTYSESRIIYSVSKDDHKLAHEYTVNDKSSNELISFFFTETKTDDGIRYVLEMIRVKSIGTDKVTQTLNIISIDNLIQDHIYDSLLQAPVGYGCKGYGDNSSLELEHAILHDEKTKYLLGHSFRIEFEATGTMHSSIGQMAVSDTINVELIRTHSTGEIGENDLLLIRHKNSTADIKRVLNYYYHIQFEIDNRIGSCNISNIEKPTKEEAKTLIEFTGTKMNLNITLDMINTLFVDTKDYYFIKKRSSKGPSSKDQIIFEKTDKDLMYSKTSRIIRTYSMFKSQIDSVKLESVAILVLNKNENKIMESYHLKIFDSSPMMDRLELGQMFDISEECYLNSDRMKSGIDFAWLEFTYPISATDIDFLSKRELILKEKFYTSIFDKTFGLFRVPKIEIMFVDVGLISRVLLLDVPPVHLIFTKRLGVTLLTNKAQGTLEEISTDVEHCSELCKFYKCKAMSFCEDDHTCRLSPMKQVNHTILTRKSCDTYILPANRIDNYQALMKSNLHNQISRFQHQDYYRFELEEAEAERLNKSNLPELTLPFGIDGTLVILEPSKFEVEQDPSEGFDLRDKLTIHFNNNEDQIPPFHEGVSMHRYRVDKIRDRGGKLVNDLNYEQCAIVCVDNGCSSFSYCLHRQECITTDIYELSGTLKSNIDQAESFVEKDLDCMIFQRDFLSKFRKFAKKSKPEVYMKETKALNPSECAHFCVAESNFNCFGFNYCGSTTISGEEDELSQADLATCYYSNSNLITDHDEGFDESIKEEEIDSSSKERVTKVETLNCDHYARSYLVDFSQIHFKKIKDDELIKLKSINYEGKSVDQCANICLNEIRDCTAFQFCLDTSKLLENESMQSCQFVESVISSANYDPKDGLNLMVHSENCHLFSLRKDLAFSRSREVNTNLNPANGSEESLGSRRGNLTILGGILLYICFTMAATVLFCGAYLLRYKNDFIRQRTERLRILLGF